MARLTIDQIKAPDLSVASAATARAGESFREGMSSAADLLTKYQTGLEAQGDAELTGLLAKAKNEDEWNAVLDSTDFSKMNISPAMRQQIIDRRNNILGYQKARSDIASTDASTLGTQATTLKTKAETVTEGMRPAYLQAQTRGLDASTNFTNAQTVTEMYRPGLLAAQTRNTNASADQTYTSIDISKATEARTANDYEIKIKTREEAAALGRAELLAYDEAIRLGHNKGTEVVIKKPTTPTPVTPPLSGPSASDAIAQAAAGVTPTQTAPNDVPSQTPARVPNAFDGVVGRVPSPPTTTPVPSPFNNAAGKSAESYVAPVTTPKESKAATAIADAASSTDSVESQKVIYRDGIGKIEADGSGGYSAIGKPDPNLGRPLGRYQIMEANLPEWSKAALGREVSVEEFMKDSKIQDAIFDHRFGGYVEKYGPEGAAKAWFAGEKGMQNGGATDALGRVTVDDYGKTFVNNIGGTPAADNPNIAGTRPTVTVNPNQGGPARQAYLNALLNSKYQTGLVDSYTSTFDAADKGQAAISAADTKLAKEVLAQTIVDAAKNNVSTPDAVIEALNNDKSPTAVEALNNAATIAAAAGDGGILSAAQLKLGTTGANPLDIGNATAVIEQMRESQLADPFQVVLIGASEFETDPAAKMISALDGLGISTIPSDVESAINTLAEEKGITRGQAAYSYARAAELETRFGRTVSIFGDNISQREAYDFAEKNFKDGKSAIARNSLAQDKRVAEQIQLVMTKLGKTEELIQKRKLQGKPIPDSLLKDQAESKAAIAKFVETYLTQKK